MSPGRRRASGRSPKSPLPADLFSLNSRGCFQAMLRKPYQSPGPVLAASDTHAFGRGVGGGDGRLMANVTGLCRVCTIYHHPGMSALCLKKCGAERLSG